MTISYSDTFGKLLLRWRGSLWKAIWLDLVIYLSAYYVVYFIYLFALTDAQQKVFEALIVYFESATKYIPLTFLLGFFVFAVVARWWDQFNWVSWPDKLMIFTTTYITGEENRLIRRTVARWANLTAALGWRGVSLRTLKRFPTTEHLVKAGLMTQPELEVYQATEGPHGKYFLPMIWMNNLFKRCHNNAIIDSVQLKNLLKIADSYRLGFAMLSCYDWVCVPLVYTQVVAIATYGYFAICLVGRQMPASGIVQLRVPIFTILQFLFYMGWLKVGQALMNPFGEDDDDFELNYILDRNIYIAYMLADEIHGQIPELVEDIFWNSKKPPQIRHTRASLRVKDIVPKGHLSNFKLKEDEMEFVDPDEEAEGAKKSTGGGKRLRNIVRSLSLSRSRDEENRHGRSAGEEDKELQCLTVTDGKDKAENEQQ